MSNKKLDSIQKQTKIKALKALNKNGKTLVRMATGTGKTETAIKIFEALDKKNNKRVLWLTHQNELIEQSGNRFLDRNHYDVGLFNSKDKVTQSKIVVGSIQSLARGLNRFHPKDFDLIIVDEAHHSPAEQWTKVINYFQAPKLGITATPYRPDGQSLDDMFGDLCVDISFVKAQSLGVLAKDKTRAIVTNSVLSGFVDLGGEYNKRQLDRLYTSNNRNDIIVKSYLKYGRKEAKKLKMVPKGICYCINSKHAKRMNKLFNNAGIKSVFVSGNIKNTSTNQRQQYMNDFKNTNKYEILCVVNLMNEGVDVPDANIALMCRPTQSNIIYSQQVGRLARINNGKKKQFIILDYVDQTNTDFQAYGVGNLKNGSYQPNEVVVEYLNENDPKFRDQVAKDIMKKAEEFEVTMRKQIDLSKVNEQSLLEYIKTGKQQWRI